VLIGGIFMCPRGAWNPTRGGESRGVPRCQEMMCSYFNSMPEEDLHRGWNQGAYRLVRRMNAVDRPDELKIDPQG
jgi:hypothetical protein